MGIKSLNGESGDSLKASSVMERIKHVIELTRALDSVFRHPRTRSKLKQEKVYYRIRLERTKDEFTTKTVVYFTGNINNLAIYRSGWRTSTG